MNAELPAPDSASVIPLSQVEPGRGAVIVSVDSDSPSGRRLLDLGFLPGTHVSVVRRAPLGDPVCYLLRGCHMALRRTEASRVSVHVE